MSSLISGLGENVTEQKWLNVTKFSSYPNFPEILGQPRTPKSLKLKFLKCLFHSLTHTEIPQFFVEWKAPWIHRQSNTWMLRLTNTLPIVNSVRPAFNFCIRRV